MILAVNKAVNFWKVEHGQMKIKFQGDCQIESELCISCKDLYAFTYVDKSTVTQYINVLFQRLKAIPPSYAVCAFPHERSCLYYVSGSEVTHIDIIFCAVIKFTCESSYGRHLLFLDAFTSNGRDRDLRTNVIKEIHLNISSSAWSRFTLFLINWL